MKEVVNIDGNVELVSLDTPVKTIDGKSYLLSDSEQTELQVRSDAWQAESVGRNALVEIAKLEAEITPRRLRDAILGNDNGWLTNQEALIAVERNKL